MIRIETEKRVVKGIASRKIERLEALKREQLPSEYLAGGESLWLAKGGALCHLAKGQGISFAILAETEIISEEDFQVALATIRRCGERLMEINMRVKALQDTWQGRETFLI